MRIRLTCEEDGSSKFWEGEVSGSTLTVRFGRIGTEGQTKDKELASPEAARHELQEVAESKRKKGDADAPRAPESAAKPSALETKDVERLCALPSLRRLVLPNVPQNPRTLAALGQLRGLETLSIDLWPGDALDELRRVLTQTRIG